MRIHRERSAPEAKRRGVLISASLPALLLGSISMFGPACSSTPEGPRIPTAPARPAPTVEQSQPAPELTALVDDFYRPASEAPLALLKTRAAALLQKHPRAWEVHEVSAYLARLGADEDAAWQHFLAAAADLRDPDAHLHLNEALSGSRTRSQTEAEIAVLQGLSTRHPDATVRDAAKLYLVSDLRRLGRADEAARVVETLPHLNDLWVLGAFDNDQGKGFLTVYPPEESVRLDDEVPGALVPIRYRRVEQLSPWGEVPLFDMLSPAKWSIGYLVTWISVPEAMEAELRLSTGDPVRAWVNDRLVVDEQRIRGYRPDNLVSRVKLARGWNQVLIKSAQETGAWSVRARLTRVGGAAISGLLQTHESKPYPKDKSDLPAAATSLPAHLHQLDASAASGRQLFLRERYLSISGRHRQGLEAAQAFMAKAPGSRVAQFRLAIMLDLNQEAGKAIDLLNRVVDEAGEDVPWFLWRRARFFSSKKQYGRAEADLSRILAKHPNLTRPRVTLANVFKRRGFAIDRCRTLDTVLEQLPDSAWLVNEKADCLRGRGFVSDGYALTEVALALEPGSSGRVRTLMDRARNIGDFAKAEEYGARLIALRPTSASARLRSSKLAHVQGDREGARTLAQEAMALDPDDARIHRLLGDLDYEDGDKEKALANWERAIERDPDDNTLADLVDHASTEGPGLLEELAPTSTDIAEAIALGRARPSPPGTRVALLLDHEVTEIKNDGSARALVTIVRLAVNKQGGDSLIRMRVPASRTKILQAYALTKEGERQEASSIRGGNIRFRRTEPGSITVVQYLTHRRSGGFLPNHFVSGWFFQGVHRHYRDSTWVVLTPPDRKLNIRTRGDVEQTETKRNGYVVRTFRARDVPPLIPEPYMPPAQDILWRVSLSTVEDWDEYVRWERALLRNAFRTNEELEKLAAKLTEGATTTKEKFDKLFHYVAQDIRYQQDYENTIAGVKPHSCPVVLERGYGDCKDKAVLLILLARKVGLDVDFAILRTSGAGEVEREIPNQQFNHAIVYVPAQEGIEKGFFIDPTTDGLDMGNLRSDDQGAVSLVLDPDTGKWSFHDIPWQPPSYERTTYTIGLKLGQGGGAEADIAAQLRGSVASSVRRALRDDESRRKLYDGLARIFFAGASAKSGDPEGDPESIWNPLQLRIQADAPGSVHEEPDGTRIDLPLLFPLARSADLPQRRHPLVLGIGRQVDVDFNIDLAGRKALKTPEDFAVSHPCFRFSRQSRVEEGKLVVGTRFEQTCHRVQPDDYKLFREEAQKVVARQRDVLMLSR